MAIAHRAFRHELYSRFEVARRDHYVVECHDAIP
jgi:hypothetical protein